MNKIGLLLICLVLMNIVAATTVVEPVAPPAQDTSSTDALIAALAAQQNNKEEEKKDDTTMQLLMAALPALIQAAPQLMGMMGGKGGGKVGDAEAARPESTAEPTGDDIPATDKGDAVDPNLQSKNGETKELLKKEMGVDEKDLTSFDFSPVCAKEIPKEQSATEKLQGECSEGYTNCVQLDCAAKIGGDCRDPDTGQCNTGCSQPLCDSNWKTQENCYCQTPPGAATCGTGKPVYTPQEEPSKMSPEMNCPYVTGTGGHTQTVENIKSDVTKRCMVETEKALSGGEMGPCTAAVCDSIDCDKLMSPADTRRREIRGYTDDIVMAAAGQMMGESGAFNQEASERSEKDISFFHDLGSDAETLFANMDINTQGGFEGSATNLDTGSGGYSTNVLAANLNDFSGTSATLTSDGGARLGSDRVYGDIAFTARSTGPLVAAVAGLSGGFDVRVSGPKARVIIPNNQLTNNRYIIKDGGILEYNGEIIRSTTSGNLNVYATNELEIYATGNDQTGFAWKEAPESNFDKVILQSSGRDDIYLQGGASLATSHKPDQANIRLEKGTVIQYSQADLPVNFIATDNTRFLTNPASPPQEKNYIISASNALFVSAKDTIKGDIPTTYNSVYFIDGQGKNQITTHNTESTSPFRLTYKDQKVYAQGNINKGIYNSGTTYYFPTTPVIPGLENNYFGEDLSDISSYAMKEIQINSSSFCKPYCREDGLFIGTTATT